MTQDPSLPVLTLNWEAPANVSVSGKVLSYSIKITSSCSSGSSDGESEESGEESKQLEVEGDTTMLELSDKDGLQPLRGYVFEVRAESCEHARGAWSRVDGFVGELVLDTVQGKRGKEHSSHLFSVYVCMYVCVCVCVYIYIYIYIYILYIYIYFFFFVGFLAVLYVTKQPQ